MWTRSISPARNTCVGGPSASGGMVSLEGIELLLAERAQELGVDLRRGVSSHELHTSTRTVSRCKPARNRLQGDGWSAATAAAARCASSQDLSLQALTRSSPATPHRSKIADPEKLRPGFNLTERGMYINGPGPDRIGVVEFDDASFDRTHDHHAREPAGRPAARLRNRRQPHGRCTLLPATPTARARRLRIARAVCCSPAMRRMSIRPSEGRG